MKTRHEIDALKNEDPLQWALESFSDPRASQAERAEAGECVYHEVQRRARRGCSNEDDRQEVAQEAILRLIKVEAHAKSHTVGASSVIAYCVWYARRDWYRSKKRLRERSDQVMLEFLSEPAHRSSDAATLDDTELLREVQEGLALVLEDAQNVRTAKGRENARQCSAEWLRVLTVWDVDWPDIWSDAERDAGAESERERGVARNNAQARHTKFRRRLSVAIDVREASGHLSGRVAYVLRKVVSQHVERQRDS